MKAAAKATYGRKGDKIVQMNYDAIDAGAKQVVEIEVPESWKDAADEGLAVPHIDENGRKDVINFVKKYSDKSKYSGRKIPSRYLHLQIMQTDQLRQDLPHTRNVVSR